MKQGKIITRVILVVFLAAILIYLGFQVFGAVYDPLTTTTAVATTVGESYGTEVWLIREEQLVTSNYYITSISLADGEKVSAGGAIARGYSNDETYSQQAELDAKLERLAQLQISFDDGRTLTLDRGSANELDDRIDATITTICTDTATGDLRSAAAQTQALQTLVLRRSASEVDQSALEQDIRALEQEISLLRDRVAVRSGTVSAPCTGFFCASADGYESALTPTVLLTCGTAGFAALTERKSAVADNVIGRLVTDRRWYAAALVPEEYAARIDRKSSIEVDFGQTLDHMISMEVEQVAAPVDGLRLVVLSSDSYLSRTIAQRTTEAGLVLQVYSGIHVPKAAIRLNEDGKAGVYVVVGAKAEFKPVTILYENGENYVVEEDRSSTDNLWVGDEIIVSARGLYNGKVVK